MRSIKQHQPKNADAREANIAEMIAFHCLLARVKKSQGPLFKPPMTCWYP